MRPQWAKHFKEWGVIQHAEDAKWHTVLLSLLLTPPQEGWHAYWQRFKKTYPHIGQPQLGVSDLIRIPLQYLWLALVPPTTQTPYRFPWRRYWQRGVATGKFAIVGLVRWLKPPASVQRLTRTLSHSSVLDNAVIRISYYVLGSIFALLSITTPFDTLAQTLFIVIMWFVAWWATQLTGPAPTLTLIVISLTISTRYLWWRITSTLNWEDSLDLTFGLILLVAELYAWSVLVLGYFQTSWMLRRRIEPLPSDMRQWPTVDIFIPIYNEPLRVVKPTLLATQGLDWPKEKFHIYLLDDGHRDELRQFAAAIGIHYLSRQSNHGAKAGNINHALQHSSSEYVAIFDCDHIPVRSFLQVTLGGFLLNHKLALVQTPHHFFSPDPFERNLRILGTVPSEGKLFYGRTQDGNDLWNATFFCGSCAVLRRSALIEIGGIATDTVTEDAHTSLRLHRAGYHSSYLNLSQAAGLATESLSAHIQQRMRWARGMAQIFRTDNPMTGHGLTLPQRLCYTNAMLHFLYGLPRLVFLTAPIAFLIFHSYAIYAPALQIALYVLPHMLFSMLANSRMDGGLRRSFWGEIYETVLASHITIPTTLALLLPTLGKFNVTAKGGIIEKDYFNWTISRPYLILQCINLTALVAGIARLLWGPDKEIGAVVINLFWVVYNLLILGVAVAVARESRQVRIAHRVPARLPIQLYTAEGHCIPGTSVDFSEGGMALTVPHTAQFAVNQSVTVILTRATQCYAFAARILLVQAKHISVRFDTLSLQQERELVQCTFGRADAWLHHSPQPDRPITSLFDLTKLGIQGYTQLLSYAWTPLSPHRTLAWHYLLSLLPRQPVHKRPS